MLNQLNSPLLAVLCLPAVDNVFRLGLSTYKLLLGSGCLVFGFRYAAGLQAVRDNFIVSLFVGNVFTVADDQDIVCAVECGWHGIGPVSNFAEVVPCGFCEQERVVVPFNVDQGRRVATVIREPMSDEFLAFRFSLASRQDAQQGSGSGSDDEMSSIHWVRSYGGRFSISPWLRLYAAQ